MLHYQRRQIGRIIVCLEHCLTPSSLIDDEMLSLDRPNHAATNGKLSRVSRQREVPVVTVSFIS